MLLAIAPMLFAAAPNAAGGGDAAGGAAVLTGLLCPLVIGGLFVLVMVVAGWKIFTKAGQPGWASLVPIYGPYVLVVEVCKMEIMWFIFTLIPCLNFIAGFKICMELAKKFGKEAGFGIGLFLLSPIFAPMLAFGSAEYQGGGKKRKYRDDDEDEEEEEEEEDEDDRPKRRK